jgi:hypothetical protein
MREPIKQVKDDSEMDVLEERRREQEFKHKLPLSSEKIPNARGSI